jgi:hypothetical protein
MGQIVTRFGYGSNCHLAGYRSNCHFLFSANPFLFCVGIPGGGRENLFDPRLGVYPIFAIYLHLELVQCKEIVYI